MRLLTIVALLFSLPAAAEVTIDWVTVGGPGNACDTQSAGCFGLVAEFYRISRFEVTNAQYAELLSAVAASDPNTLYNEDHMGDPTDPHHGGITRSGFAGAFTYSPIAGRENMPVNWVSFYDALRFANWLHNGQPTGAQGADTTEDGAYTITPAGISANSIVRNAEATVFLASEDEWYKAAYYDAGSASYFDYSTGSDTAPTCATPSATPNTANCSGSGVFDLTAVGSYTGAASPSGTFDQGGNLTEWNEGIPAAALPNRVLRGGSFLSAAGNLAASIRNSTGPSIEFRFVGFRVASPGTAPPPFVPSMGPVGVATLWSLLGLAGWWRLRR